VRVVFSGGIISYQVFGVFARNWELGLPASSRLSAVGCRLAKEMPCPATRERE
jgi:hypothetical protein